MAHRLSDTPSVWTLSTPTSRLRGARPWTDRAPTRTCPGWTTGRGERKMSTERSSEGEDVQPFENLSTPERLTQEENPRAPPPATHPLVTFFFYRERPRSRQISLVTFFFYRERPRSRQIPLVTFVFNRERPRSRQISPIIFGTCRRKFRKNIYFYPGFKQL